jgi:hypothetical protein
MLSELVRTEDELREFYKWLLSRAYEEESRGKAENGRVYRDYAKTVSQEIVIFEHVEKCSNM